MGRGTSKVGGTGRGSSAGGRNATKSISGKPFDSNDYTTWTIGTQVVMKDSEIESIVRGRAKYKTVYYEGKVTEINGNRLTVTIDGIEYLVTDYTKKDFKAKKK